jgi:hypothetical protein
MDRPPVHGESRDGVVHYSFQGQNYTLSDRTAATFHETTVYLDPGDPATAILYDPLDRWVDVFSVGSPLLVAAVLLALGFKRQRRARSSGPDHGTFGHGIDQQTVQWLRERQRRGT